MNRYFLIGIVFLTRLVLGFSQEAPMNQYQIEVSPELEAYGKFELLDAELRIRKNGRVKLTYHMPKELVGNFDGHIQGEGRVNSAGDVIKLRGEKLDSAECLVSQGKAQCHMIYNETLPVLAEGGEAQVIEYLKKTVSNPTELEGRTKVLSQFVRGLDPNAVASHEAGGWFENIRIRWDR